MTVVTSVASGTETLTLDTPYTLNGAAIAAEGIYTFWLDVNAMLGTATPDILTIKINAEAIASGTARQVAMYTLAGVQGNKVWRSPPFEVIANESLACVIEQTDGTGRAIPWEIRKIGS